MSRSSLAISSGLTDVNEHFTDCYAEQINVRQQTDDKPPIVQALYDKLPVINATALANGCWQPPRLNTQGRNNRARHAYQRLVGSIPPGYHLHHLCPNRWCINPTHLEVLSPQDHRAIRHPDDQRPWGLHRRLRRQLEEEPIEDPYHLQMAAVARQAARERLLYELLKRRA